MSRTISLIVLALMTAAVVVPIASSGTPTASCSQADDPSGCYQGRPFVDPLAVSYLGGMGLTAAQIKDWTVGVCSHATKPAVCVAAFQQTSASTPTLTSSSGFEWGDATIGAAATLGAVLLLGGLGAILVMSRHGRRRTIASA